MVLSPDRLQPTAGIIGEKDVREGVSPTHILFAINLVFG
jgi:hypothetical protein